MQLTLLARAWRAASVLFVLTALACSDPVAPNKELAETFDELAEDLEPHNFLRQNYLQAIAHTLRRGAPVNKLILRVNGVPREFSAVAIQWGFAEGSWMTTSILAWRGTGAPELFYLAMEGSTLVEPDTTPTSEDSAVYIGNARHDVISLLRDTTEQWYFRSGEGERSLLSVGLPCTALSATHTCQSVRLAIRFDVITRLAQTGFVLDPPIAQQPLAAARTELRGIRYLKACPVSSGTSTSCFLSLVSDTP